LSSNSPNRRQFLGGLAAAPLAAAALGTPAAAASLPRVNDQTGPGISAEEALRQLLEGNRNFVAGNLTSLDELVRRRTEVVTGQAPMAVLVSCSDSRVPPEIVFDRTLGELFVVRTAGQVVDAAALASITYAVDFLRSPLVVVMGHSRCGAVDAALAAVRGGTIPGYAFGLAQAIGAAARRALSMPGDALDNAIRINAQMGADEIRTSEPLLTVDVAEGRLTVVAAYYDFQSGLVTILS
jgi:carbonic anhydrase